SLPPDKSMNIIWMFFLLLPVGILLFFWISYRRSQSQLMGGGFLSGFSKSPAKLYETTEEPITFKDVAGLQGVKADLAEIVDYLKDPTKYQRLGGRVPKGVLLNGPPGTGKTLLARAVAGEADVPFFSVSGSEFIQMFVGVGASRVRDLFQTAKDNSPSIIFVDEIDAVGRQRGAGLGGGHDEREQTLNQILSEMDGFNQNDFTIVLAATNRPDVLDPALLRPGRFDRHVSVNRPTLKGRRDIFKVHVRDVPLAADVDLGQLAAGTVGLTGADIRNMVNEAALWAARQDKNIVEKEDFEYARDKILMGAKREEVLQEDEKEKTAYHEAGHTLTAWKLAGANAVHKVTIVPRGRSLGSTQTVPSEDRMSMSENELRDHLTVLLGGRAAEQLIYDETTVGAENDLERATSMARRMVTHWGMSERLGPVSYKTSDEDPFLGREIHQQRQFSEHTMEIIDSEVTAILHNASQTAYALLKEHDVDLKNLAETLLSEEELDEPAIAKILGPSVHSIKQLSKTDEETKTVIPAVSQPTSGDTSAEAQQVTRDHHSDDLQPHDGQPPSPNPHES
ncbi:MAG: ATP-dependent zinc metalloprotease FtsH, partial [Pirellulaceae bacterium]